jgi:HSP20 family protein
MEKKELANPAISRPSLFDGGWMEKFFNAPLDEFFTMGKIINTPAVNVSETEKEYTLTIGAPGLEKTDFKIETSEGMLTISAEKEKEEKNGRYNRREYNYSSWRRSFTLPEDCDPGRIQAAYKNGELSIRIPRTAVKETKKVQQIAVN